MSNIMSQISNMQKPLATTRQMDVFKFIIKNIEKKHVAPTIPEISKKLKINSYSVVHRHLRELQKKGYLYREKGKRQSMILLRKLDGSSII